MLFHTAQVQQETNPTRLTGLGKNCSTIPVDLLDQCFPHEESKTFGIEFRLPPTGGKCDDGLIICYLGSLATRTLDNSHSMNGLTVNSKLFNVDNAVNNALGKYCAGLNFSWHGIKVRTEKLNGKSIMKLSTSLLGLGDEESFEIDAQRQLFIHFGNENYFFAYVTADGGEPFEIARDKAKREAFTELAPKGAHLKDFVGFWTLGLDMLPWMDHDVELFVNRSCSCSMEAWFIRPTDRVPNDPKEPSTGIGGPNVNCIANTTMEVPLNNSLKANHLIRIQMLIDGNVLDNSISFELLDLSKKNSPMTFTISTRQTSTIEMKGLSDQMKRKQNGSDKNNVTAAYLPKGNGTCHADFIIAFTEYSYGIVMNKKLLDAKEFFLGNWWNGLQFKDMAYLRLRGQFLLLTDPIVMPFFYVQQNYKPEKYKPPRGARIPNLQKNTKVTFRVKLHSLDNDFNISFLHNRIESSKPGDLIGAEILRVNVRPETNQIFLQSYKEGKPLDEGDIITLKKYNKTLEAEKAYEFYIVTGSDRFNIALDGITIWDQNNPLPIWATNFVRVDGNITLLGKPAGYRGKLDPFKFSNFTIHLKSLLDYNDVIQLRLKNHGKAFSILLLHDALEANNEIGDVVLKVTFEFNETTCSLSCSYLLNAEAVKNATAKDNYRELTASVPGRLNQYGQDFNMDITALNDILLTVQKRQHTKFEELSLISVLNCPPATNCPPAFEDDVQVHAMNVTHPPSSEQRIFKQITGTRDLVKADYLIIVKLAIRGDLKVSSSVTINLFHEALELHNKVGKTVMKVMLNVTALYFSSSKQLINNSSNEQNCTNGKLDKELKELEIRVMGKGFFNVTVKNDNDNTTCTYNDGLPEWAVQYITFEHNDVTLFNPPNITCVPEKRCMEANNGTEQYNVDKASIII
uniref:Galectin domain-containing protein n=1 Tax=Globodera rostochiensis TaxID=31243 RepID=A0A914HBU9_GLORO